MKRYHHCLWFAGSIVATVASEQLLSDVDARYMAIASHDRVPLCDAFESPTEKRMKICLSEVKRYDILENRA